MLKLKIKIIKTRQHTIWTVNSHSHVSSLFCLNWKTRVCRVAHSEVLCGQRMWDLPTGPEWEAEGQYWEHSRLENTEKTSMSGEEQKKKVLKLQGRVRERQETIPWKAWKAQCWGHSANAVGSQWKSYLKAWEWHDLKNDFQKSLLLLCAEQANGGKRRCREISYVVTRVELKTTAAQSGIFSTLLLRV